MAELVTKSVAQEQQEQKTETRTAMKRIVGFPIVATAVAAARRPRRSPPFTRRTSTR